ncbi:MAG: hypothetical protein GXC76_06085 [Rhodanobacteraceae bacterium]|jgi:hypothetical protein|nr:hypothetical protein [Rhodanobacteraceae bacterium]
MPSTRARRVAGDQGERRIRQAPTGRPRARAEHGADRGFLDVRHDLGPADAASQDQAQAAGEGLPVQPHLCEQGGGVTGRPGLALLALVLAALAVWAVRTPPPVRCSQR